MADRVTVINTVWHPASVMTPRRRVHPAILLSLLAVLVAALFAVFAMSGQSDPAAGTSPGRSATPTAATLSPAQVAYLAAVRAADARYATHTDRSLLSDGDNTCADLRAGEDPAVLVGRTQSRFTRGDVVVSAGLAAQLLAAARLLCPVP